ncbi:MAG: hypothetical protein HQM08_08475 [Candidatus Riflebacteria bacterium]|nr:hypothetical protein [Candidatus Riflebacteria bacterium]
MGLLVSTYVAPAVNTSFCKARRSIERLKANSKKEGFFPRLVSNGEDVLKNLETYDFEVMKLGFGWGRK